MAIRPMAVFRVLLNVLLFGACVYYLGTKLQDSWGEWIAREIRVSWTWVSVSLGLNLSGLCVLSGTWTLVMRDHQRSDPSMTYSTRKLVGTYLFSQIGKYVPGKAVVVWIRYVSLASLGMTLLAAAFGTLFETLFNMGVAAGLGSLLLGPAIIGVLAGPSQGQSWLLFFGLSLGIAFLCLTMPPVFHWVPRLAGRLLKRTPFPSDHRISWRVYGQCLASSTVAWLLMSLSYVALLQSVSDAPLSWLAVPASMGVFMISFVSGFLSLVPGHAGVRDALLTMLTAPILGGDDLRALSASLLSRLVTLSSDLVVAGVAGGWMSRRQLTARRAEKRIDE